MCFWVDAHSYLKLGLILCKYCDNLSLRWLNGVIISSRVLFSSSAPWDTPMRSLFVAAKQDMASSSLWPLCSLSNVPPSTMFSNEPGGRPWQVAASQQRARRTGGHSTSMGMMSRGCSSISFLSAARDSIASSSKFEVKMAWSSCTAWKTCDPWRHGGWMSVRREREA